MLYRLFHILLAFLLLISSTGLVLSQHYCLGELKSSALFADATPCYVQQAKKRKCQSHTAGTQVKATKRSCCDTTVDFLQLEDDQLAQDITIPSLNVPVLISSLQVVLGVFTTTEDDRKACHYLNYKPPLLVCDRPVSFQTFLC
ncbi:MAG: hypothetical protein AAFP77_31190 [Bacteroidota bacterium]